MFIFKLFYKYLTTFGSYLLLMGRSIAVPERMRMFFKRYVKEMSQLGVDSIGIVLLISFFIGAVICIQMKVNIQSPWMPRWVSGYTTREIMLLEFSSSIMCLILAGKVGSNIASELGTTEVTLKNSNFDFWSKKIEVNFLLNNAGVTVKILTPSKLANDNIEQKLDYLIDKYKQIYSGVTIEKLDTVY